MIYAVMPTAAIHKEWLAQTGRALNDNPDIIHVHDEYQLAGVGRLGDRFIFCNTDWLGSDGILRMQSLKVVAQLAASKSGALLEYWERPGQRATKSFGPRPGGNDRVVPVDAARRKVLPRTDRHQSRGRQ